MSNEIIKPFKDNMRLVIDQLSKELSGKNPNKIDIDKVKSTLINSKPLKTYEHSEVMIYPQGTKSIRIDIINNSSVKPVAVINAMTLAGYMAIEKDNAIYISLHQLTTQDRDNLIKEIKEKKEKVKQKINSYRSDAMNLAKKLPKSDKEKAEKDIEKIKEEFYSQLDKAIDSKIKEINTI